MSTKKWCLFAVALTIFLAIMDNAESYIGSVPGDDIESRAKHAEGKVPPHVNLQKRLKMRKKQVKRNLSLTKIIFIGPFKEACSCVIRRRFTDV